MKLITTNRITTFSIIFLLTLGLASCISIGSNNGDGEPDNTTYHSH